MTSPFPWYNDTLFVVIYAVSARSSLFAALVFFSAAFTTKLHKLGSPVNVDALL